ncbi:MAG TPA: 4-hydroxybenzoate octaprenyltransferase [Rhodospirillaceae bacterium]|nr:4-hydroxybenzoate octaprenyltransferase [Rhodospirillaceae bacterium]
MSLSSLPHTDIRANHAVFRLTPEAAWPYLSLMRLDRPIGTWLLLLPAWWAMAMESRGLAHLTFYHLYLFILFAVGAVMMRGAGCVINDIWDRDIDKAVERTRNRPLASGQVSVKQALMLTAGLLFIGLLILIQLPWVAILLGLLSLVPVILYPLAKRVTWYPQAVLGLTFNFGALIGAAAVTGTVPLTAVLLYVGGFFWTMGYDTIYAHQDIVDDGIVGIKSTARKFGDHSRSYIAGFYILFVLSVYLTGMMSQAAFGFYIFWAAASLHFLWQVYDWKIADPQDCLRKFRSNRNVGFLVLAAYFFGYVSGI